MRRKRDCLRLFFCQHSPSETFFQTKCADPGSLHPDAFQRPRRGLPGGRKEAGIHSIAAFLAR